MSIIEFREYPCPTITGMVGEIRVGDARMMISVEALEDARRIGFGAFVRQMMPEQRHDEVWNITHTHGEKVFDLRDITTKPTLWQRIKVWWRGQ